jgi:hypothetical protein
VGPNPNGYATNSSFHAWIDGGFYRKMGGVKFAPLTNRIQMAKIVGNPFQPDETFRQVMDYILGTEKVIEPLYQLEKAGKLTPENPQAAEGRAFLDAQLVRGGQMLGDLWFSAWQQATEDKYLIARLKERAGLAPAQK